MVAVKRKKAKKKKGPGGRLAVCYVDIGKLKPWKKNPRLNDDAVDSIVGSIERFGYTNPILVRRADSRIIAGHTRVKALKQIGEKKAPVIFLDIGKTDADLYALFDNKSTENTDWDRERLGHVIMTLEDMGADLGLTGFNTDEIAELKVGPEDIVEKDDEIPNPPKKAKTKRGDLYIPGEHRLLCGDSANKKDIIKLNEKKTAALLVTSPPYGVGKDYETKGVGPWFDSVSGVIARVSVWTKVIVWQICDLYSTGSQFIEPTSTYSINMFAEQGFKPIWIRIWLKPGMNYGVGPYHLVSNKPVQQYEHIVALAKTEEETEEIDIDQFEWIVGLAKSGHKFVKRLTNTERRRWGYSGVWKLNSVKENDVHPAMYPVELPMRCIKMHTDEADIILDPFLGSGTTLIAAEKLNRRCFGMEIDPVYCDVIVERWESFTGKKAKRQRR
jgi:DNA modification methylase